MEDGLPFSGYYTVERPYADIMRFLKLDDALAIFEHPKVEVWRKLADRENCTFDGVLGDGREIRLHIKRYTKRGTALLEAAGLKLLRSAGLGTAALAGEGQLPDGRNFLVTEDLDGYEPADQLLAAGVMKFDALRDVTASCAAKMHAARLRHRDLYLCHFFVNPNSPADVRLIDTARVSKLPRFFARRWVVKDLAQFWFSTLALPVTAQQRDTWLSKYLAESKVDSFDSLKRDIERKSAWIARHDAKLNSKQPARNVSIPR